MPSSASASNFKVLEGFPADTVAIEAHGQISGDDYENLLIPLVERKIKEEGKVKMMLVIGPDFKGYTAGAMWDDAKLGFLHLGDFARMAVVSDVDWIRMGVKMFAPLIRYPVSVFTLAEKAAAEAWIMADGNEPEHKPGVAATRKLPTSEDM